MAKGDPQADAVARVIAAARPDVIVLQGIDYDAGGATLDALSARIGAAGWDMPYAFSRRPNSGRATGRDLDGDGRLGGPGDAIGWARFAGSGGLAVLSRHPIPDDGARDFSDFAWAGLPGGDPVAARADLPLPSVALWVVPIAAPDGPVEIVATHATPPVFDGPEDGNGRRNRDETALILSLIDGRVPGGPTGAFVVAADLNADPEDGEARREALDALLTHPRVIDPRPRSRGGTEDADPAHGGDPSEDTVAWEGPGNLRVDYVLPSTDWRVAASGVVWPRADAPTRADVEAASRHRLVWADIVR